MEAKELMIGDWVCCINGDCHFGKVPTGRMNISGYGSGNPCKIIRLEHIAVVEFEREYVSEYGSLQPIPLTPELLEKNGFVCLDDGGIQYNWYDWGLKNTDFSFNFYNEDGEMCIANCIVGFKYVHELQQALRVCKLDNLADNFKV